MTPVRPQRSIQSINEYCAPKSSQSSKSFITFDEKLDETIRKVKASELVEFHTKSLIEFCKKRLSNNSISDRVEKTLKGLTKREEVLRALKEIRGDVEELKVEGDLVSDLEKEEEVNLRNGFTNASKILSKNNFLSEEDEMNMKKAFRPKKIVRAKAPSYYYQRDSLVEKYREKEAFYDEFGRDDDYKKRCDYYKERKDFFEWKDEDDFF